MIRHSAIVLALLAVIGLDSVIAAPPQTMVKLNISDLVALKTRAEKHHVALPKPASLGMDEIVAYEEHKDFVCIVGQAAGKGSQKFSLLRRVIVLKPSILVVDDQIPDLAADARLIWRSSTDQVKQAMASRVVNTRQVTLSGGGMSTSDYTVKCTGGAGRVVFVVGIGHKDSPKIKVLPSKKTPAMEINLGSAICKLALPVGAAAAGSIAITDSAGKAILPERVLPSGIMPHGPKGVKMLAGWDSRYTRKNAAPWDTKKVAVELKKAVESGKIKPGRAVVLGCGAGTNSIYLASKGFDVTAIDVAPTALEIARQRAAKAKVKVNWVLADVTAVPKLKPFDFMYDRGCYHGVRRSFAKEFVASAKKLSKPGTQFLILAGNANEARHYGPPRVKEADIRNDFKALFDFTWLRESKFGPDGEKGKGPLMWSILMTRKSK